MAVTVSVADMYMGMLMSLPNDAKLDLIGKLTESMRSKKLKSIVATDDIFACFHSDWGGDAAPEEVTNDLRQSRMFNRKVETW